MAGGMGRGRGVPLGDRVHAGRPGSTGGARHCWVRDERYAEKLPGLLLRWEQQTRGWRALVVVAVPEQDGLVQRWVDGSDLSPC